MFPTLLALAGVKSESAIRLDGIDLTPAIEGKLDRRPNTIGFWHHYTKGQSTWSDRIIKALMEAQQAGKPNPHPERVLKNVNAFPARKPLANGNYPGHAAIIDWPYKIHTITKGNVTPATSITGHFNSSAR